MGALSLACSSIRMIYWGLICQWEWLNLKQSSSVKLWLQVIQALMADFLCHDVLQRRFSLSWLVERNFYLHQFVWFFVTYLTLFMFRTSQCNHLPKSSQPRICMIISGLFGIFTEVTSFNNSFFTCMVGGYSSQYSCITFGMMPLVTANKGQPKRHLLTTGWSHFVSGKRLFAGDSVLFIRYDPCLLKLRKGITVHDQSANHFLTNRDEKQQLLLGIRRANRQPTNLSSSVLSSDSMHIGILAAAAHAAANNSPFTVFYNPRWLIHLRSCNKLYCFIC